MGAFRVPGTVNFFFHRFPNVEGDYVEERLSATTLEQL